MQLVCCRANGTFEGLVSMLRMQYNVLLVLVCVFPMDARMALAFAVLFDVPVSCYMINADLSPIQMVWNQVGVL